MSVRAIAKGVRLSPRKVGVVAALVRGRSVSDAIAILEHVPRRPAIAVRKVIESARANAENNYNLKPNTLAISEISVTAGPRIKRYRPSAFGRVSPYQHKTSHIRVVVDGEKRQPKQSSVEKSSTPGKLDAKPAKKENNQ